jgi:Protein of unknown function (DUF2582).
MLKNDIGIHAGVIWNLLSENGKLTVRGIGEQTNYREDMIHLAVGWLARENKICFSEENNTLYIELTDPFLEKYY